MAKKTTDQFQAELTDLINTATAGGVPLEYVIFTLDMKKVEAQNIFFAQIQEARFRNIADKIQADKKTIITKN